MLGSQQNWAESIEFQASFLHWLRVKENYCDFHYEMKEPFLIYLLWKSTQKLATVDDYVDSQFIVSYLQIHPSLPVLRKQS